MVWRAANATIRSRRLLKNGSAPTSNAPGRACTISAKALSISASLLALKITTCFPIARAAASDSRALTTAGAKFGLTSMAIVEAVGTTSCSSPRRFSDSSVVKMLTPVALPPGRARLLTRPDLTGSVPLLNTIGIVAVAQSRWRRGRARGRGGRLSPPGGADARHSARNEIGSERRYAIVPPLGPSILDHDIAAMDESRFRQSPTEAVVEVHAESGRR